MVAAITCLTLAAGCGKKKETIMSKSAVPPAPRAAAPAPPPPHVVELPKADQRLGTAVVILLDTSGSMSQNVPDKSGRQRPKEDMAKEALDSIVASSRNFLTKHPDRVLELGMYRFSSGVQEVLPVGAFNAAKATDAVRRIPKSSGGTAIGDAMEAGFKALYKTGCTRKYLVCITDGMNTAGQPPEAIGNLLFNQTGGEVEIHFVAFDTDPRKFGFLEKINGHVVPAQDGAQLAKQISDIYEKRILAEAPVGEK